MYYENCGQESLNKNPTTSVSFGYHIDSVLKVETGSYLVNTYENKSQGMGSIVTK